MTISVPALLSIAAALLSLFGEAPVVQASSPAPPSSTDQCVEESYRWGGDIVLGGAEGPLQYDTGVEVPGVDGASLTVVGVSADGVDERGTARALPVSVGGVGATTGASVPGGTVVVAGGDSAVPVSVAGVTVVIARCSVVASDATYVDPAAATAPRTAYLSLPATGADEWRQTILGAAILAAGLGLVTAGRRAR
jgi:hypothetical protein